MFEVGKKVIAIKDHSHGYFRKGDVFELLCIKQFCKCAIALDVGLKTKDTGTNTYCPRCGYEDSTGVLWCIQTYFAPYDDSLSSITVEELLEEVEGTAECYCNKLG